MSTSVAVVLIVCAAAFFGLIGWLLYHVEKTQGKPDGKGTAGFWAAPGSADGGQDAGGSGFGGDGGGGGGG